MKNKKMTLVASALAVSGVLAGIALAANGVSSIIAEENTHSHTANCSIHHYAAISPTASKAGVKEYWICCNDPMHTVSFEAPTTGDITDATHPADFAVAEDDERYVAPYTFPEVFSTPWAYDTKVTIEEGKVKSQTNTIHIKGSVLKEAYSLGYTHFKFRSYGDGEDVGQIVSTQDSWQKYYRRYANSNDNRFWLKSFYDESQGLKVSAHTAADADAQGTLELSNFELFKSSVTESWGSGAMANWLAVSDANKYIAYENGELVFDNAGGGEYSQIGEIPASVMGEKTIGSPTRMITVKPLSEGIKGTNDRIVIKDANGKEKGYAFKHSGQETVTSDGFIRPWYADWFSAPGLVNDQITPGALSLGLDHPGAIAIRINQDFTVDWKADGVSTYMDTPLANSADNSKKRFSLTDIKLTSADGDGGKNQFNVLLPNSVDHKGIKATMISTIKPADHFVIKNLAISENLSFPKFDQIDGVYKATFNFEFTKENQGVTFILRFAETSENGSFTFEYSWID